MRKGPRCVGVTIVARENISEEKDNSGSVDLGFQSESDITFEFDLGEERVREMGTLLDLL